MARHKTRTRMTGAARGVTFAILGLTGLAGAEQIVGTLGCFFGASLNMALETLPSIVLAAWHILQPSAFTHAGLWERLLQVSLCWQFVLRLTGA